MRHTTTLAFAAAAAITATSHAQIEVFDLEFGGGSAADYVREVEQRANDANIVVLEGVGHAQLPAISLKNVTVGSALSVLDDHRWESEGHTVILSLDAFHSPPSLPIYTIDAKVGVFAGANEQMSTVISVARLLSSDFTAEDILTAVETVLELHDEFDRGARIKFHEETGLIMARGYGAQIDAIHEVIQQLERSSVEMSQRQSALEDAANAHAALADAETRSAVLQDELMVTRQRMAELEMRLEQSSMRAEEADTALREATEWKTRGKLLEDEMQQLRVTAQDLNQELQAQTRRESALRSDAENRMMQLETALADREAQIAALREELERRKDD